MNWPNLEVTTPAPVKRVFFLHHAFSACCFVLTFADRKLQKQRKQQSHAQGHDKVWIRKIHQTLSFFITMTCFQCNRRCRYIHPSDRNLGVTALSCGVIGIEYICSSSMQSIETSNWWFCNEKWYCVFCWLDYNHNELFIYVSIDLL